MQGLMTHATDTLAEAAAKPDEERSGVAPPDLSELFTTHRAILVYHVTCCGAEWQVAEELVQDTFIRAMEQLDSLREPDKALPWLRRIAENIYNDAYRREGRYKLRQYEAVEMALDRQGRGFGDEEWVDPLQSMADPTGLDDVEKPEKPGDDLLSDDDVDEIDEEDDDEEDDNPGEMDDDPDEMGADDDIYADDMRHMYDSDDVYHDGVCRDEDEDDEDDDSTTGGVRKRRQRRKRLRPEPDDAFTSGAQRMEAGFWKYSPELELLATEQEEQNESLELLLPKFLSSNQQRVLQLRYAEELSYDEIGRRLGISAATARTHVKRARQHLRRAFLGGARKRPSTRRDLPGAVDILEQAAGS